MSENLITYAAFLTSTDAPPFHSHQDHEILFITSGEVELALPSKTIQAKKGDLVFLSNYESYHTRLIRGPYKRYMLSISSEIIALQSIDPVLLAILRNHPAEFNHCVRVRDVSCFQSIFSAMVSEYNSRFRKPYTKELQRSLVIEFLIRSYRTQNRSALFMLNTNMRDRILSMQDYIDKNFRTDLRIHVLCEDLHINPSHFSRMFKTYVGMSPKQYLTFVRMDHVRTALSSTNRSITNIAMENGFIDINNFTRTFRKTFGLTPSQYREHLRKENKAQY